MSFLKKFQKKKKSIDSGSIGSNVSIQSVGLSKGILSAPYSVNEKELPPFLKAIWKNDLKKVKNLMKKNYCIVDKEKRSGLHLACAIDNIEIVRELLQSHSNDLLERQDIQGRTALFKAVEAGALDISRILVDKGAKTNVFDNLGDTLVHAAVKLKNFQILEYLLDVGCDGSVLNKEGLAPIHLAASVNYIFGIDVILDHGFDVNQRSSTGKTALIMAAESGNYDVVRELLSKNADFTVTDNDGKNAHYYADFHEYDDCALQLKSVDKIEKKASPKRPSPLQMPEFIVSQTSEEKQMIESTPKTPPRSILRNKNVVDDNIVHKDEDLEKNKKEKRESRYSITSDNSWSGDISHYSSDNTLPIMKSNPLQDVSTPSSMPNPSEDTFNPLRPLSNGVSKTKIEKQFSDDEESQWTDSEPLVLQNTNIKNDIESQVNNVMESKVEFMEPVRNNDSDWDSDTEIEKNDAIDILSTIDEESGGKQDLKTPKIMDGHQTDSNIEDIFENNYMVLNKPVRYDSNETLENSIGYDDEETDLSQTTIPNPKYGEEMSTPISKPPVSPLNKTENIPIIKIEDFDIKKKLAKNASGDNLSYTSTEHSSHRGSFNGSDTFYENDKTNLKLTEEYIKKCSNMESKLRKIESEKNILEQDIKLVNESKRKLEVEKSKLQKDYQKMEVTLSEKKDELDEYKSRFIVTEELLKTREKELFESKKINQDLVGSRNEMEMKNISYNSKINQLQQEITNLQSVLQRSSTSGKDSELYKSQLETERAAWLKDRETLNIQILDLQQQLSQLNLESEKIIGEQRSSLVKSENQIKELKICIEKKKDDDLNQLEEMEQLKKTIKNLNADLESSNKSAALVAKEVQKNKNLTEQLATNEEKATKLNNELNTLKNQISDFNELSSKLKREIENLRSQLSSNEDNYSRLELRCKTSEKQAFDLEKLLETKNLEVKDISRKYANLDEDLLSDRSKSEKLTERLNGAISSAINECSDSEEVLLHLQNIRKLVNNCDGNDNNKILKSSSYQDMDSSIELSKAKSEIRVLQNQLENLKKDLKESKNEANVSKKEFSSKVNSFTDFNNEYRSVTSSSLLTQLNHISNLLELEMDRIDKIEKIEKENRQQLNENARSLRKSQQEEKQKSQLIYEKEKSLSLQLNNEIKRNQSLMDVQDSIKEILYKYKKQIDIEDKWFGVFTKDFSPTTKTNDVDLLQYCSKILEMFSNVIEETKLKLKKVEFEKLTLEEEQKSRDQNQEILLGNSKIILTQQLSELTQMMDNQRNNREKLEKIRDENEFQLRNELYQLKQSNLIEVSELNQMLTSVDKDREALTQEIKNLNEQLLKERHLKDSLAEQLVNVIKNPSGSIQQFSGGNDSIFPSTIAMNTNNNTSQWNIPYNIGENSRKPFFNSMSNLSILKSTGIEDEEFRQKMRSELDRSITKHLESGKPIRQLNVKDKIRSLNIVRYPSGNVAWKAQ